MEKIDLVAKASKKVFDSLSEKDKEKFILSELRQIENDKDFQKIKRMWDKLDDDRKNKTYIKWNIITLYWSSKLCAEWILPSLLWPLSLLFKNNRLRALAPVIRVLVHVWLLDAPKQLWQEELMKNIQDDADNLERNLEIFWKVSKVIPHPALQIASKIVSILIPYAEWYKENWASLMQDRVKNQLERKTWETIAQTFSIPSAESQWNAPEYENIEKKAA